MKTETPQPLDVERPAHDDQPESLPDPAPGPDEQYEPVAVQLASEATPEAAIAPGPVPSTDLRAPAAEGLTIERLVAQRLQRMANPRLDQRKLARLIKAVIDQINRTEALPRPITVGARDHLAEAAATRLFRQRLKANDLPQLLARAASQLPAVATRIETQIADTPNQRRDRIDARQLRRARQAGVLDGLDPWG